MLQTYTDIVNKKSRDQRKSVRITNGREIYTSEVFIYNQNDNLSFISTANSEKMEENTKTSGKAKDFFLANNNAKAKRSDIATERLKGL